MRSYHDLPAKGKPISVVGPTNQIELSSELLSQLAGLAVDVREGLLALSVRVGLKVMEAMLEEEVATIVGPKGRHSQARTAYRHGHEEGSVVLGGRKVAVTKPRVRSKAGQEVVLQVFQRFQAEDVLHQAAMDRMLHGISTRRYHKGLEDIGSGIYVQGISKSSISRNFMQRTRQALAELLERRFDATHFVALFIDGFALGDHLVITAMGLDAEGQKHILSIREGATENTQVSTHTRNVKRWRNGEQVLRWMAAALLEVEKRFRRIKAYKEIPVLIDLLAKSTAGLSASRNSKRKLSRDIRRNTVNGKFYL